MTDEPGNMPEARKASPSSLPYSSDATLSVTRASGARIVGVRRCPHCGSATHANASVCPACGESLKAHPSVIRCRRCGEPASSELALCPHCGRELLAAPPRLVTWGIPSLLVVLFVAALAGQLDGRNPISWVQSKLPMVRTVAGDGANRGIVVVMTPVPAAEAEVDAPADSGETADQVAVVSVGDQGDGAVVAGDAAQPGGTNDALVAAEGAVAAAEAEQPAEQRVEQAEQPTPVEVAAAEAESVTLPTATLAPVAVATDTPSAVATEAPAKPPAELAVVASVAAGKFAAMGGLPTGTPEKQASPTPTSTWTPEVAPTATPAPTETATATPLPAPTYQIRRGDTLIVVARRYEVSLEDLMQANDIEANEAFTIQPGQILIIPTGDYQPPATSTPEPTATPMPAAPPTATAVPTPAAPQPVLRLDALVLRSPEPGTPVSCSAPTSLVWLPVPFMRAEDKYVMHLGFVNGRTDEDQEIVIWVLEQPRPSNVTSWDMDASLCSIAPQEYGRQWRWYVEVAEEADGRLVPVSPPSAIWGISWN